VEKQVYRGDEDEEKNWQEDQRHHTGDSENDLKGAPLFLGGGPRSLGVGQHRFDTAIDEREHGERYEFAKECDTAEPLLQ